MRIIYSQKAKSDLFGILEYYGSIKQLIKGRRLRAKLILATAKLRDFPKLGKKDEDFTLKNKTVCRALIVGNYKIIYRIVENEYIRVLRFYDMRQQ